MEKNLQNASNSRFSSIKDVEKTEITSARFTHVPKKGMLYAKIYEPDENHHLPGIHGSDR